MSGYPLLKSHDPDGTRLRTIEVVLDTGDSLLSGTTLVPVDPVTGGVPATDSFAVEFLSMGLIQAGVIVAGVLGDLWGVNFRLHNGDNLNTTYAIRLRPILASQSGTPAYDQTFLVFVEQT